jgi:hypothetical protein
MTINRMPNLRPMERSFLRSSCSRSLSMPISREAASLRISRRLRGSATRRSRSTATAISFARSVYPGTAPGDREGLHRNCPAWTDEPCLHSCFNSGSQVARRSARPHKSKRRRRRRNSADRPSASTHVGQRAPRAGAGPAGRLGRTESSVKVASARGGIASNSLSLREDTCLEM